MNTNDEKYEFANISSVYYNTKRNSPRVSNHHLQFPTTANASLQQITTKLHSTIFHTFLSERTGSPVPITSELMITEGSQSRGPVFGSLEFHVNYSQILMVNNVGGYRLMEGSKWIEKFVFHLFAYLSPFTSCLAFITPVRSNITH